MMHVGMESLRSRDYTLRKRVGLCHCWHDVMTWRLGLFQAPVPVRFTANKLARALGHLCPCSGCGRAATRSLHNEEFGQNVPVKWDLSRNSSNLYFSTAGIRTLCRLALHSPTSPQSFSNKTKGWHSSVLEQLKPCWLSRVFSLRRHHQRSRHCWSYLGRQAAPCSRLEESGRAFRVHFYPYNQLHPTVIELAMLFPPLPSICYHWQSCQLGVYGTQLNYVMCRQCRTSSGAGNRGSRKCISRAVSKPRATSLY